MKIVLHKEVEKLGVPGDVVQVADGYARNYLIPKGYAAPATKGAAKNSDRLRRAHDQKVQKAVLEAREVAAKLTASPLQVTARAGEEGKLFGSVTSADIARELEARTGATVDRRTVHLAEPIRSLGTHEATVRLHRRGRRGVARASLHVNGCQTRSIRSFRENGVPFPGRVRTSFPQAHSLSSAFHRSSTGLARCSQQRASTRLSAVGGGMSGGRG
jgi:large subunit ribosomal protein L9